MGIDKKAGASYGRLDEGYFEISSNFKGDVSGDFIRQKSDDSDFINQLKNEKNDKDKPKSKDEVEIMKIIPKEPRMNSRELITPNQY